MLELGQIFLWLRSKLSFGETHSCYNRADDNSSHSWTSLFLAKFRQIDLPFSVCLGLHSRGAGHLQHPSWNNRFSGHRVCIKQGLQKVFARMHQHLQSPTLNANSLCTSRLVTLHALTIIFPAAPNFDKLRGMACGAGEASAWFHLVKAMHSPLKLSTITAHIINHYTC